MVNTSRSSSLKNNLYWLRDTVGLSASLSSLSLFGDPAWVASMVVLFCVESALDSFGSFSLSWAVFLALRMRKERK